MLDFLETGAGNGTCKLRGHLTIGRKEVFVEYGDLHCIPVQVVDCKLHLDMRTIAHAVTHAGVMSVH